MFKRLLWLYFIRYVAAAIVERFYLLGQISFRVHDTLLRHRRSPDFINFIGE